MRNILTLVLLFVLLASHELFLKSDTYFFEKDSQVELYLFNGTFDTSENVITRDRIINAKILGPQFDLKPSEDNYYDKGEVTYLKFRTGEEGTYTAGISTKPRVIELNGQEFSEYLEHEGLSDIIANREKDGSSNDAAREKYSKHVKAIFQVDDKLTDHFSKNLQYPIEFIPLVNPYDLSVGDEISFKLLYMGQPLANQTVHISSRKDAGEKGKDENSTRTNDKGEFSFNISNIGQWYVATIHMFESKEDGLDYESNWATLTFEVR